MELEKLISVGVITYNSEKYILDALESIYNQTYKNIELVISDDGSKDSTINLCVAWIKEKEKRFSKVKLIKSEKNTGTSANMNRLFEACSGTWVKAFAGDDQLLPNTIENFAKYVDDHSDDDIVFSKVLCENDNKEKQEWAFAEPNKFFKTMTKREIYFALLENNFLPAPSVFINKAFWRKNGKFEEGIPLIEDWPFWIKTYKKKCRIGYMDEYTVIYRFSETSVSQHTASQQVQSIFLDSFLKAEKFASEQMKKDGLLGKLNYAVWKGDEHGKFEKYILKCLNFFNPYKIAFNKAVNKKNKIIKTYRNEKL